MSRFYKDQRARARLIRRELPSIERTGYGAHSLVANTPKRVVALPGLTGRAGVGSLPDRDRTGESPAPKSSQDPFVNCKSYYPLAGRDCGEITAPGGPSDGPL